MSALGAAMEHEDDRYVVFTLTCTRMQMPLCERVWRGVLSGTRIDGSV